MRPAKRQRGEVLAVSEGNLAFTSEQAINRPQRKAARPIMDNPIYDPQKEAFSQPRMLMTVIAMTLGLCLLWVLIVFALYRIARLGL